VLAVCGDLGCTRERLVALLWPESDEARAQQGLRDALYAIRRSLDPGAVLSAGRLLTLDPTVVVSDVQLLAQALSSGRHADAVQAYAGPLLDGFHVDDAAEFEHWLEGERARLARQFAEALEHLARVAESAGAWHEAVRWWGRAVEHDPVNSHFVLQHARAMAAIGDRPNALKAATDHARRLREQLDLEPDGDFLAAIERIRKGETPARPALLPRLTPGPADAPAAHQLLLPREPTAAPSGPSAPTPAAPITPLRRRPRWVPWAAAAVVVVLGAFAAGRWLKQHATRPIPPRTAIAVLPFAYLGADSSHAYFAGGLHDELLTRLSSVAELKVIGPTSVRDYPPTSPLRQIAEQLEVGSIAVTSVEIVGNQLRVFVRLLDPVTGSQLWVQTYDRILDDAFAVQSDIAQRIANAVGATLTSAEAAAIAAAPTQNKQAYDFYLQGRDYFWRPGFLRPNLESAQQLYQQALALDPAFALAHAALSKLHFLMYHEYDTSPARLEQARREAALALRLAPDLPQAHLVAGLARYIAGDPRGALAEFKLGRHGAPNDAELWGWIANVNVDLGNWDSVLVAVAQARRLDPRNANLLHGIGDKYHYLHRYRQAIEAYRGALALAPDLIQTRLSMAWSYILWQGQLDTLRAVLRGLPQDADAGLGGGRIIGDRLALFMMERRPDSALSLLRVVPWAIGRSPDATLARATMAAPAYILRGDTAAARAAYDTAAAILDSRERAHPDDGGVHAARGAVLAALGRRAEALREARWLQESDAYRQDRDWAMGVATILMRVGEVDSALPQIERALAGPSTTTAPYLRLAPDWEPFRTDPRFQALMAKYANPELP
jgi:TolB-like protein/DNA-binding SARP family transcriptional activator/Tfp pilus assembly protein PilF